MKKFINIIISIVIFISIFILIISYFTESIIVNIVTNAYTEKEISDNIITTINKQIPNLNSTEIKVIKDKIENSDEIKLITNKYLKGIIESVLNDTSIDVDISNELDTLYNSLTVNMNEFQKSIIKSKIDKINLDNVYSKTLYIIKSEISPEMKFILNTYKSITNSTFQLSLLLAIVFSILLMIIINKSLFKTIKKLSIILIVFGVLSSITIFLLNSNMYYITNKLIGRTTVIDLSILSNISLFTLIFGVIVQLIIILIEKIKLKSLTKC